MKENGELAGFQSSFVNIPITGILTGCDIKLYVE